MSARSPRFGNPPGLCDPTRNGYSHVAISPPGSAIVFIAGQGGERPDGSLFDDFSAQVRQCLDNLETALGWAGVRLEDVLKLTVLVVDHDADRHGALSAALTDRFHPGAAPACTLIPVTRLALEGMLVEIEATAVSRNLESCPDGPPEQACSA